MPATRKIKTADEHIADITNLDKERKKRAAKERQEQREHQRRLEEEANVADIRDATIAHIKNAGFTFENVDKRGGPCARTLVKWQEGLTINPRMTTIRRALRIVGKDIGIVDFKPTIRK